MSIVQYLTRSLMDTAGQHALHPASCLHLLRHAHHATESVVLMVPCVCCEALVHRVICYLSELFAELVFEQSTPPQIDEALL